MTERTCEVDGCGKPPRTRGWCGAHYQQWLRTGDPVGTRRVPKPQVECAIEGCAGCGRLKRGWCNAHYLRYRIYGSPTGTPPPREKHYCCVDGCDGGRYAKGYCKPHYHRVQRTGDPGPAEIGVRHETTWAENSESATCWSCGTTKDADEFYLNSGLRQGRCKECVKAQLQAWRKANPDLYRERMVGYQLRFNFGISRDQYAALLAAQGGTCAICGQPPEPGERRFHVDHDHETGAVRGILCGWCNTSLGLFGEDALVLSRAAAYLERPA